MEWLYIIGGICFLTVVAAFAAARSSTRAAAIDRMISGTEE